MTKVAAVVLAAGGSTRFGQSKQLLDWRGKPFLAHVTDVALDAGLEPVVAVLGCQARETRAALGDRPLQILMNWRWEEGMATSVQIGLAGVPPDAGAALFIQCDQPLITPSLLRAIVARFERSGGSIVHPTHAGRRGTPVLFGRRFFSELSAVTGDEGGRSLIDRYPDQVETVEVQSPETLVDVDTPKTYARLKAAYDDDAAAGSDSRCDVLGPIRHLIIDMDGVLWRGDEATPGLAAFFAFLEEREVSFVLATNNSSRTPEQYVDKLARLGVDVPLETILTSGLVSASYLADVAPAGTRVYVIGEEGIRQALIDRGFVLVDERAQYVIVAWDRHVNWERLATASLLIHNGAGFIGTNPDVTFPREEGPVPGNGAILAALEASTGVKPTIMGKPEPRIYEEGLRRMGATPESTAMIGDRLDTDIAGASRAGLITVLVLTGIAGEDDMAGSSLTPDLVCRDLQELLGCWSQLNG